jgi:16S rRNA (guanine966-N2)-methyltransferase
MRVIAGTAKGRRLAGPPSRDTRPTSDLVRGAIFSALESMRVEMTRVLDLYAGSGALGIEALSRGAAWCDFVERDGRACAAVRENLDRTGFAERAAVHRASVERAVERLEGPYTLILADPPYGVDASPVMERLLAAGLAEPGRTVLVVEHGARSEAPDTMGNMGLVKTLRHGDSAVSIYN